MNDYFTFFYVKHFELPLCMKCAIQINLPCLAITYLKRQSADIAFIQETHLTDLEHMKLRRDWVGHVFYSSFSSKARGVALLINKNLRFKLNSIETDKCGRLVLIDCVINLNKFTLVSLYGPNIDDPTFLNNLTMKLAIIEGQCILGGDFNLVLNPSMDRSSPKSLVLSKSAVALNQGMKELGLSDGDHYIQIKKITHFTLVFIIPIRELICF